MSLPGLLGQITQTADVSSCPGKCIHALASLMCDTVLEEVQCPAASMRCCVERDNPVRKPNNKPNNNNKPRTTTEATTTTKRRRRTTTPPKTTPRTTLTTTKKPATTTKRTTTRVKPTTYSVDRSSAPGNDRSSHTSRLDLGGEFGGDRGGRPISLPVRPVTQRTGSVDGSGHSVGDDHGVRRMDTTSSRSPVAPAVTAGAGGPTSLSVLVTLLTLTLTFVGASRTA